MRKKLIGLIAILILGVNFGQAQKLKSGSWTVSIDDWAKSEKGMFGEQFVIYDAKIKIMKGTKKMRSHMVSYNETKGGFVVKDLAKKVKEPNMSYDAKEGAFILNPGADNEQKMKPMKGEKAKNIVLSGMIIWLEYKP